MKRLSVVPDPGLMTNKFVCHAAESGLYFPVSIKIEPDEIKIYLSCESTSLRSRFGRRHKGFFLSKVTLDASHSDIYDQFTQALSLLREEGNLKDRVNVILTSCIDPMYSKAVRENSEILFRRLYQLGREYDIFPRFTVATSLSGLREKDSLSTIFPQIKPEIFYFIGGSDTPFKQSWQQDSLLADEGLEQLDKWQDESDSPVKVGLAFIHGQNDSQTSVYELCRLLEKHASLNVSLDLLRYDDDGRGYGEPSDQGIVMRSQEILRKLGKGDGTAGNSLSLLAVPF